MPHDAPGMTLVEDPTEGFGEIISSGFQLTSLQKLSHFQFSSFCIMKSPQPTHGNP